MTQAKKTNEADSANNGKEKTSLYLKQKDIKSLKYIAFMSGKTQTKIIEEALNDYTLKWEAENEPIPKKFLK